MKSLFSRIALVGVGLLLPLVFLEVVFNFISVKDIWGAGREALGEHLTDCLEKDEQFHHVLEPNCEGKITTKDYTISLQTNSLGFRDDEFYAQKSDDIYRIVVIGDSFTEGWGVEVEDRFDRVMENRLKEVDEMPSQVDSSHFVNSVRDEKIDLQSLSTLSNVEVINTGVRSHSPILHLQYLSEVVSYLEPDLVLMMFDLSDLHDDYYYGGWGRHYEMQEKLLGDAVELVPELPSETSFPVITVARKSALFRVIYDEVVRRRLNKEQTIDRRNLSTDVSLFAKATDWEGYREAWNLPIANMILTNKFLVENNIEFVVSVIPRGIHVSENEWSEGREILGIEKDTIYEPKAYFYIDRLLVQNGIKTVDLHIPLIESDEFPLYHAYDGHWTTAGNRIVGETLAAYLEGVFQR